MHTRDENATYAEWVLQARAAIGAHAVDGCAHCRALETAEDDHQFLAGLLRELTGHAEKVNP